MAKASKAQVQAALREYMRELGAKGGKLGGRARAEKLTAEQRRASARKAAQARWAKSGASSSRRRTAARATGRAV
jgi:hypothetical protein